MPFNSVPFGVFFALVLGALTAARGRHQGGILLAASLLFYGLWAPWALLVLAFLLVLNWTLARAMAHGARRSLLLAASVVLTLGTLAWFKYEAAALPVLAGHFRGLVPLAANAEWATLPIGISFYSFEIISIAVDVHAGRLACPTFGRYALFVTFFPHLIAGPILRGGELLPQLERGGERTPERTRRGTWLFAVGLVKKVLVSDYLLQPFVQDVFVSAGAPSGPAHLVAMYGFAFQIYSDFSGYSDMARGLACVLGFELPMNFEEPYLSRSPAEFWRRWHMTLSRWLRDYLYVPLGGNRKGRPRTALNLLLTMTLGGLWHGAGFHFVVWGALHGVFLVLHRFLGRSPARDPARPFAWSDVPRAIAVFHVVCLLWIPFRASSWTATVDFLRGLAQPSSYGGAWPTLPLLAVLLAGGSHVLERALRPRLPALQRRIAGAAWGPVLEGAAVGAIVTLAFLASGAGVQFIYFQF